MGDRERAALATRACGGARGAGHGQRQRAARGTRTGAAASRVCQQRYPVAVRYGTRTGPLLAAWGAGARWSLECGERFAAVARASHQPPPKSEGSKGPHAVTHHKPHTRVPRTLYARSLTRRTGHRGGGRRRRVVSHYSMPIALTSSSALPASVARRDGGAAGRVLGEARASRPPGSRSTRRG